jgi:hypothetical protein
MTMRTRNFLVPQDLIFEFVEAIEENDFSNHIVGITAESEIEISIDYDTNQRKVINQLQDMIDEHNSDENEDKDESEEEDEDEDEDKDKWRW